MAKLTIRNIKKQIEELARWKMTAKLSIQSAVDGGYEFFLIPVTADGQLVESEIMILHDGRGNVKKTKTLDAAYSLADRYGFSPKQVLVNNSFRS